MQSAALTWLHVCDFGRASGVSASSPIGLNRWDCMGSKVHSGSEEGCVSGQMDRYKKERGPVPDGHAIFLPCDRKVYILIQGFQILLNC